MGTLVTPHGALETPAFIFCATKGAIKGLTMEEMRLAQTQIILANTFHLLLSPGPDIVQNLGGLAKMAGWGGPTLTDSGGYQIFSMGYGSVSEEIKGTRRFPGAKSHVKIHEEGAEFRACHTGEKIFLTPERSTDIQRKIGADLIVAFDECTPYHVERAYTEEALRRSHRWEKRSLTHFKKLEKEPAGNQPPQHPQALYGVVQGGVYEDLRRESCDFVNQEDFFGHAIGGSLGENKTQMQEVVGLTRGLLRNDRPVHLLGIGRIDDIFHGVALGIDTFDCVHPTRIARHGGALVKAKERARCVGAASQREHIPLHNSIFCGDATAIEEDCACVTCQHYSRGYVHHLLKNKEMLGPILIARHNVYFMNALMADIRQAIPAGTLAQVREKWLGYA